MQLSLYVIAALSLGIAATLAAPFPGTEVSAQSSATYHWHGCGSVGSCSSDSDCQVDENCLSMAQNVRLEDSVVRVSLAAQDH
ncbi:hypothetical protein ASPACDRAFT_45138 [Aspergillus aculeatus ATCC 16872]|uniref:Uncharacterized protein n=1 Tax=Aspergillus aculeatus (strain ATCC 16872 / CBS 172.66 / WB 5094) TaxID=690307 RepID=A0A1L9WNU8_ASPA1|nr:uncharacterized protein ASPACDRAFT_45138 [Aspergillus aculeatus ATCC 16872]OJJ97838.1 hypothetical protein ASPACDRAFT_45138 [Aspergillus aculeatus ATCC 16872]